MHAHAQVMHKLSACASKLALVLGDECAASSRRLLAASDSAFFLGESTILAGRAARTRTSSARGSAPGERPQLPPAGGRRRGAAGGPGAVAVHGARERGAAVAHHLQHRE